MLSSFLTFYSRLKGPEFEALAAFAPFCWSFHVLPVTVCSPSVLCLPPAVMLVSVTDDTKLCVGVNVSTREWCLYLLVSPAIGDLYSILQPVTGEIGSSTAATLSWVRGRKCLNEPINLPRECVQRSGSWSGCFPIDVKKIVPIGFTFQTWKLYSSFILCPMTGSQVWGQWLVLFFTIQVKTVDRTGCKRVHVLLVKIISNDCLESSRLCEQLLVF